MPKKQTSVRGTVYFRPNGPAATNLDELCKRFDDDRTAIINSAIVLAGVILTGPTATALASVSKESGKTVCDVLTEIATSLLSGAQQTALDNLIDRQVTEFINAVGAGLHYSGVDAALRVNLADTFKLFYAVAQGADKRVAIEVVADICATVFIATYTVAPIDGKAHRALMKALVAFWRGMKVGG